MTHNWAALADGTLAVYESSAATFDADRNKSLFERAWLDRFCALLPPNAHILDAGCGTGDPIARYLMFCGHRVTGIDAASAMIAQAQRKFPNGDWRVMDLRALAFDAPFDGVLGWNSFFHLTQDEQRVVLPRLADLTRPGGPLMVTIGEGDGTATGTVAGQTVYHASLDAAEYQSILSDNGCEVLDIVIRDQSCNGHSVLLGRRRF